LKIKITKRDQVLLDTLSEFHLLSTKQIRKLVFKNCHESAMFRRLRKLEKGKFIERITRSDQLSWVWSLGVIGREKYGMRKLKLNKNSLTHDLICNDIRIKLEELKVARLFKSSFEVREKLSSGVRPKDRPLDQIPDWICSMSFNSGVNVTSLEVELNYKGKRRMEKVIETYSDKSEIEKIIYFVPTLSMGKKMLEIVKDYEDYHGVTWFLFISIDDFLLHGMNSNVYFLKGKRTLKQISPVLSRVYGQDSKKQSLGV